MQEIVEEKRVQVLNVYVDIAKKYIVNNEFVSAQEVIDYLDGH